MTYLENLSLTSFETLTDKKDNTYIYFKILFYPEKLPRLIYKDLLDKNTQSYHTGA